MTESNPEVEKGKPISRREFLKLGALATLTPAFNRLEKTLEVPKIDITPDLRKYFPPKLKKITDIFSRNQETGIVYSGGLTIRVCPEENRTLSDEASKALQKVKIIIESSGRADREIELGKDGVYTFREDNHTWYEGDKILLQPSSINWGNPITSFRLNEIEGKITIQINTILRRLQGTAPRPPEVGSV
jgi:hypothetical protein